MVVVLYRLCDSNDVKCLILFGSSSGAELSWQTADLSRFSSDRNKSFKCILRVLCLQQTKGAHIDTHRATVPLLLFHAVFFFSPFSSHQIGLSHWPRTVSARVAASTYLSFLNKT